MKKMLPYLLIVILTIGCTATPSEKTLQATSSVTTVVNSITQISNQFPEVAKTVKKLKFNAGEKQQLALIEQDLAAILNIVENREYYTLQELPALVARAASGYKQAYDIIQPKVDNLNPTDQYTVKKFHLTVIRTDEAINNMFASATSEEVAQLTRDIVSLLVTIAKIVIVTV